MEFKLIIKKLNQVLTPQEENTFKNWYNESILHRNYFDKVKANYHKELNDIDVLNAWKDLENRIERKNSNRYLKYAVAASIVLFISISIYNIMDLSSPDVKPIIVNHSIEVGTDKATLTLGDGSKVVLGKGEEYHANNVSSNGEELVYDVAKTNKSSEITYNYLTIPRGGQFFIKLSDGTQVWLNSESQLKYPVSFIDGELRKVELVYGEAYFDVSPSTNHNGSKFKVYTGNQEVEIFGTEFNIKAYKDEDFIYTTLVEGKVLVEIENKKEFLEPSQQSTLNINSNNLDIKKVRIEDEISWVHGEFIFYNKPLKEIMKVLSRWYDVDIIFQNNSFQNTEFNGELSKQQKIEDILELIKKTKIINDYEINNNVIILK